MTVIVATIFIHVSCGAASGVVTPAPGGSTVWNVPYFSGPIVLAVRRDESAPVPQLLDAPVEIGHPLVLHGELRDDHLKLLDLVTLRLDITCQHFEIAPKPP